MGFTKSKPFFANTNIIFTFFTELTFIVMMHKAILGRKLSEALCDHAINVLFSTTHSQYSIFSWGSPWWISKNHFIKSLLCSTHLFKNLYDGMGITQEALLNTEVCWLAQGNILVQLFELLAELAAFFMEHHLLLTDRLIIQTCVLCRHFLYSCHFRENNYVVSDRIGHFSSKNYNFTRHVLAPISLTTFQDFALFFFFF